MRDRPIPTQAHPFEQQPGEPSRAYAAFVLYRDLGPKRTLDEASRLHHTAKVRDAEQTQNGPPRRSSGQIRLWADRWAWRERVKAWDAELDRQARETVAREMLAKKAQTIRDLDMMKGLAKKKYLELVRKVNTSADAIDEMPLMEARMLYMEAEKLSRLLLGEPTDISEQRGNEAALAELKKALTDARTREALAVLADRVGGYAGSVESGDAGHNGHGRTLANGTPPGGAEPSSNGGGNGQH